MNTRLWCIHPSRLIPILLTGFLLLIPNAARSQAACQLSMNVGFVPVQQLAIGDIDFEHFESRSLLFTLNIRNPLLTDQSARLHISLDVRLADGTTFDRAIDFQSKTFQVPPGGKTITNLDLGRRSGNIETEQFRFDERARDRLQDAALGTGRFPAGVYVFNIELTDTACGQVVSDEDIRLILENPTRVELRSPRNGEITGEFPLFEWFHDGGGKVVLTVAEQLPNQSREEALARRPAMLEQELRGQNSFLYTGGRPLEQGKTYVWCIQPKSLTSGGVGADVNCPIGFFTVGNPANISESSDPLLIQLEAILGQRYHGLFEQIRNGHFKLTGINSHNNAPISQAELEVLVNELRDLTENLDASFE